MKQCPKCNATVEETYVFCHKCGADLRIPICAHCGKELPQDAVFCPWCGKGLADKKPSKNASVNEKVLFTEADQQFFQTLLERQFTDGEIRCTSESILWEKSCDAWGAVDDTCWEITTLFSMKPLKAVDREKYVNSGKPIPRTEKISSIFQEILDNSQGCLHYESLGSHFDNGLNIDWKKMMIVSNPYGIGMDLILVHEHFDDRD